MIEGSRRPAAAGTMALVAVVAALYVGRPLVGVTREAAARQVTVVEGCRTPAAPRDVTLGTVVAALNVGG